jgi:hypothetical protein
VSGRFTDQPGRPPLATAAQHGLLTASDYAKLALLPPGGTGCRLFHSVNQAIATATDTALAFDSEYWDTDAFHDGATNNTRITIPAGLGGKYAIYGAVEWASSAAGIRIASIIHQGATIVGRVRDVAGAADTHTQTVAAFMSLGAGEYLELRAYQSSGGALNAQASSAFSPSFGVLYLGG